ncbi:MAG: NAD(P)-binding protein [Gammaproteobacteria bacterium]|nr:NAD(P)-binding protein [Gammaproteobacteria bacterium]
MDKKKSNEREDKLLGLDSSITRRDFIGSSLIGTGAALMYAKAPAFIGRASAQTMPQPLTGVGPDWTGPGGIGDYSNANGNTHEVINDGHGIRNGSYEKMFKDAIDSNETYDLVVVGGGFSGLSAAYRYHEDRPEGSVLILDNHAIFGGEAKQNEFEVDGVHLWGPQGSNGTVFPPNRTKPIGWHHRYWDKLGLPQDFKYQAAKNSDLKIPKEIYGPMHVAWEMADQAHYYEGHGMVMNPWNTGFKGAPISDKLKREYMQMELYKDIPVKDDWHHWLDSMTYSEFLTRHVGVSRDVEPYLNPQTAAMGCGLGADVISAYSAYEFIQPGVLSYKREAGFEDPTEYLYLASFPGGNTGVARHMVKAMIPKAITGGNSLTDVLFKPVDWKQLDRAGHPTRIRLSSTVAGVMHDGSPASAKSVSVIYYRDGKLHRIKAKNVVMASGQWVNRIICKDLPPEHREAMASFHHAPIHTINIALRNWKFLDRMGAAAVRWFEGYGWFFTLRKQMIIDGKEPMPLDPGKPTVLTMYNSFCIPGLPLDQQATAARMQLFSLPFAAVERGVREQFNKMFASYGFDAKRDIAGIVSNRWGHAYVVSPPGFYYGKDGKKSASDIIREPHGRIAFGHSELTGAQLWNTAAEEGERAAKQILDMS